MANVLSWKMALQNGCEPRLYSYKNEDIPVGAYAARLDFKIWSKRAYTMSCYFTQTASGCKFQLPVYRRHSDDVYGLPDGDIDFKECPVDADYDIQVETNEKGKAIFLKATVCRK